MPIKIACACGKQLAAPDTLAGKQAKCPQCGQLITVPAPRPATSPAGAAGGVSGLLDEVGVKASRTGIRCPECRADMAEGAILCVSCGYRVDTGKKLKTIVELADGKKTQEEDEFADIAPKHGVELLDKAELDMLRMKMLERNMSQGFPWWGFFILFVLLAYVLVGMMIRPPNEVLNETGLAVVGLGALAATWFGLVLLVIAFRESWKCGLMYLLVPFYALYYVFTRWKRCKSSFLSVIYAGVMMGLGAFIINLAPMAR